MAVPWWRSFAFSPAGRVRCERRDLCLWDCGDCPRRGRAVDKRAATGGNGSPQTLSTFFLSFERVLKTSCQALPVQPPSCFRVLAASAVALAVAQAKAPGPYVGGAAWRRWHSRSGDRPSALSGPRRKEPRRAAARLHVLETKFLLFWAGQERDTVLSRLAAPRFNCSGLVERNLAVATLWPAATSGTRGGRRFRTEKAGRNPR